MVYYNSHLTTGGRIQNSENKNEITTLNIKLNKVNSQLDRPE